MPGSTTIEGRSPISPLRPQTPHKSYSFTRLDSPRSSPLSRSRASTLQNDTVSEITESAQNAHQSAEKKRVDHSEDIFEKDTLVRSGQGTLHDVEELDSPQDLPEDFNQLPIELISMIDRFIESLGAKVHNTPPSIDKLSDIFQDFYAKAESHIATHISALSTRQSRGASPSSFTSSASGVTKNGRRARSLSTKSSNDPPGSPSVLRQEQQMLTPQEISDRRKARRLLDRKGVALEEAVEQRVCERVYNRIWRHRSTLDEVRDEKLRSRTAALALVGIGLKDLGIEFDTSKSGIVDAEVEKWISKARDGLLKMNDAKYPLGKLQQLAAAHKCIVDLLTALHQSSSSADEILPTLIYTLITTPPAGINVISNLHFIQRFRVASKVDGEAAYCLVNLEAAITFLETVDLASLRSDEPLEGPPKSASRPSTPHEDTRPEWLRATSTSGSIPSVTASPITATAELPLFDDPLQSLQSSKPAAPTSPTHQRKLSNIFQPPASALGAAGDAVRTTADQGIKTIGNTLDSSFKLLFGRLKEHKVATTADGSIVLPKTLEDARKLVEPKVEEDQGTPSATPIAGHSDEHIVSSNKSDDSLLSAFAGRRPNRDRSVDSALSSGSGQNAAFATDKVSSPAVSTESPHAGNAAVESMINLGNTLNPLRGFSGFGVRGFGRASTAGAPTSAPTAASTSAGSPETSRNLARVQESVAMKIQPPIQRFMDVDGVEDLKVGEVGELLKDYRRLAVALKEMRAF